MTYFKRMCYNLSIKNGIFLVKESSLYWMLYLDILEVIVMTRVFLKILRVDPKTPRSWLRTIRGFTSYSYIIFPNRKNDL